MKINHSRNFLIRSRNLRSAKRSRMGSVLRTRSTLTNSSTRANSILSSASSSSVSSSAAKSKEIAMYEKMESCADNIQTTVKDMMAIGKMSYTDDETGSQAKENDEKKLLSDVKSFVSDFNLVHSALFDISGSANLAFKKSLDSVVKTNAAALEQIGITVSESGELSVDENALANADMAKVKKLFAETDGFADKISTKMKTIETSAASSLTALNKLYGATSVYNQYGKSSSYYNDYSNYDYNKYSYNNGYRTNSSSWYS